MKVFSSRFRVATGLLFLASALGACRKGGVASSTTDADGNPIVTPNSNQIIIAFNQTSIDVTKVDSVTFSFYNGTKTVKKAGLRGPSFFSTNYTGLTAGNWQATMRIYLSDAAKHMYRYEVPIATTTSQSVLAPSGLYTDVWHPSQRMESYDGIKLNISEVPTDPYFELSIPPSIAAFYKYIYMDRNSYTIVSSVKTLVRYGNATFNVLDYTGAHENTTAFSFYANAMAGLNWVTNDYSLQLYSDDGKPGRTVFSNTITNQ